MSFRVNTNIEAMNAYRNLNQTGMLVSKSITRLSTGLRINSGADDPAGLIFSESFRAQISGMDAALRNNQDAINYSKTADGALDEVGRLLREARALAVANGSSTLDAAQKQANQTQLNNIIASVNRVSSTTQFGTKKLLNGSAGAYATVNLVANVASAFVSGTIGPNGTAMNTNGTLTVQVTTSAQQATITGTSTYTAGTVLVGAGSFTINGVQFTTTATTTRDQLISMVNQAQSQTGVSAQITANAVVLTSDTYGTDAKINLTNTAGQINAAAGSTTDDGVNSVATVTYNYGTNTATASFASGRGLNLKDADGNSVTLTVAGNTVTTHANAIQVNAGQSSFQIGANAGQTARLNLQNFSSSALGLGGLDITGADMTGALTLIDSAVNGVSSARANIGSFMKNTLESNVRSLNVAKESMVATESAVRDADIAEEMTTYTKLQIIQQSGLAVLAQANQAPQAVLALLRG